MPSLYFTNFLLIAFYFLVLASFGLIPATIAKNKGYRFGLWWLYGLVLFIIAFIHALTLRDKNAPALPVVFSGQSNAGELEKYKELLDTGVITPEEFDEKKKQILGI